MKNSHLQNLFIKSTKGEYNFDKIVADCIPGTQLLWNIHQFRLCFEKLTIDIKIENPEDFSSGSNGNFFENPGSFGRGSKRDFFGNPEDFGRGSEGILFENPENLGRGSKGVF